MLHHMAEQLHDPLLYAIPFFLLVITVELVALHVLKDEPADRFDLRDSATSVSMGFGAAAAGVLFRAAALLLYAVLYTYLAPWQLPTDRWETWVGVLLAIDLLWYVYHRGSHRIRLIWAAHQAHHNSNYFNTSTALRQKWNQWFETLIWLPLPLLGVPPWMVLAGFSINLIYQFFTHTESIGRLPRPIELVLNTPSHHRVHHGSDELYLDKNYGGILIIWDRLFGTFQAEAHRPTYGLTTPIYSNNLVELQFHEYAAIVRDVRAARTWRERLGYMFAPPGWQPTTTDNRVLEEAAR
ncbi:MAG TPA: sterol desaturase family protein [Nocardioidaceae bacterium]|nr:sterol desaturase family protein [Nocardioidaceae bacterium]